MTSVLISWFGLHRDGEAETSDQVMDWHTTSRSQSRTRGLGMGMGMGMGMDWYPGSRSQSRSRPSQLHIHTTGMQNFEYDDAANGNVNGGANGNGNAGSTQAQGGVAIPQSVRANGQGAGGTGSGGSGRSLLTRSLQLFSESPPVVGYGGWTSICRPTAPQQAQQQQQQQQSVREIGQQPQSATSSEEQNRQTEQQEAQDEEDFGGFMSSSLPVYPLGFSFARPSSATTTTTAANASPYAKHVRRTSFDHPLSVDGTATSGQRLHPPKVPESALVCHLVMCKWKRN